MLLNELKVGKKKSKKRVGRGGKRGTYSGRGQKGQKARAGRRLKPREEELIKKIPKLKGIKNRPFCLKPVVFNIKDLPLLEKKLKTNVITKELLLDYGYLKRKNQRVKLLGQGEVEKPFQLGGFEVSEKAKEKIIKAGGQIL